MSSANQNDKHLKHIYSADASRNRNLQEDANRLYMFNMFLMIIYYVLLAIFVGIIFTFKPFSITRIISIDSTISKGVGFISV